MRRPENQHSPRNKSGADGGNRTRDLWVETRYVTSTPRPHILYIMVGVVGVEPTLFTTWDRIYSPEQNTPYLQHTQNWYSRRDSNSHCIGPKPIASAVGLREQTLKLGGPGGNRTPSLSSTGHCRSARAANYI